jgi:hypothetical protein
MPRDAGMALNAISCHPSRRQSFKQQRPNLFLVAVLIPQLSYLRSIVAVRILHFTRIDARNLGLIGRFDELLLCWV